MPIFRRRAEPSDPRAREARDAARAAWEAEDWATAAARYEEAVAIEPDGPYAERDWFDAALACKFLRDWPRAYELGLGAAARASRRTGDPAHWNLGIAATILGHWDTARTAWRAYGLKLPAGDGEVRADLGLTPVRLDPRGAAEVVWARRICPARAQIISVPIPAHGRRFGEIVVHDGVPVGERVIHRRTYPVFEEILRWRESDIPTWSARVSAGVEGALGELLVAFHHAEFGAEPVSLARTVCRECSEGRLDHDHGPAADDPADAAVHLAAPADRVRELLDAWRDGDPANRSWSDLHLVN